MAAPVPLRQNVLQQFHAEKDTEIRHLARQHERELKARDEAASVQIQHAAEAHEIVLADSREAVRHLEMSVEAGMPWFVASFLAA